MVELEAPLMMGAVVASLGGELARWFAVLAVIGLVFVVAIFLFGVAYRAKRDRELAMRMKGQPVSSNSVVASLDKGWMPSILSSMGTRLAERRGFSERLDARLESAGMALRSGEFVVITVGSAMLGLFIGYTLFSQRVFLALTMMFIGAYIPRTTVNRSIEKRERVLREQMPEVLAVLASSLRSGHSFMQALDTVAKEVQAPASVEFQRVVAETRLGRPPEEALEALAERIGSEDFKWAVIAVNIQREVGGNLAEILDTVAATLRERATLRRQVRALTAEGRISAWVLAMLPPGLLVYLVIVRPEQVGALFSTGIGWLMVVIAIMLELLGLVWIRKIVNFDV